MNAIDFIEKDLKRGEKERSYLFPLLIAVALLCPIGFGIGMRADLVGVFEPRILIPNLGAALFLAFAVLASFRSRFSSSRAFRFANLALLVALLLAVERVIFPVGERSTFASSTIFWRESGACFVKGTFEGTLWGLGLGLFAAFYSSWASRRWRLLISFAIGVSGSIMLGFHCDSSSFAHVLVGHVGQGVLTGAVAFVLQSRFFATRMRALFPRLENPGKL